MLKYIKRRGQHTFMYQKEGMGAQRLTGHFPKTRAFCAESAETFQAMNDLAPKRSDPVM
jgi:hypothetical protein